MISKNKMDFSTSEKHLYSLFNKVRQLVKPNTGYMQNFESFYNATADMLHTTYTLKQILEEEIRVIKEVSVQHWKLLKQYDTKHYDYSFYILCVLGVSHAIDRIHADNNQHVYHLPTTITDNERGEIEALKEMSIRFGIPRGEDPANWKF